jgi:hypothetical protein
VVGGGGGGGWWWWWKNPTPTRLGFRGWDIVLVSW